MENHSPAPECFHAKWNTSLPLTFSLARTSPMAMYHFKRQESINLAYLEVERDWILLNKNKRIKHCLKLMRISGCYCSIIYPKLNNIHAASVRVLTGTAR